MLSTTSVAKDVAMVESLIASCNFRTALAMIEVLLKSGTSVEEIHAAVGQGIDELTTMAESDQAVAEYLGRFGKSLFDTLNELLAVPEDQNEVTPVNPHLN